MTKARELLSEPDVRAGALFVSAVALACLGLWTGWIGTLYIAAVALISNTAYVLVQG